MTRHVQTRYLWVQHQVRQKEIKLLPVPTNENMSDLCTKPVAQDLCQRHMHAIGQYVRSGKSKAAKQAS